MHGAKRTPDSGAELVLRSQESFLEEAEKGRKKGCHFDVHGIFQKKKYSFPTFKSQDMLPQNQISIFS